MKKEIADKWIEALESGKYGQCQNLLKSENRFCCLGVLCDISGLGEWKTASTHYLRKYVIGNIGATAWLPEAVQQWAGMKSNDGLYWYIDSDGHQQRNKLAILNDAGYSFASIAGIIKERWEEL